MSRTSACSARLPLTHEFSSYHGFEFIWLEIWYLCPLFFLVLVVVMERLGRQLWEDPRYGLLVCLAMPGLIWQNFAAFFHEGHFELVPALFLPLVLLTGCYMARLTTIDRSVQWICAGVLGVAALQSLAGLNPFYLTAKEGHGYQFHRTQSGENVTGFSSDKRHISWRNLADAVQSLQRDQGVGATLIIADTPETASALSFYLPHNPFVYVASRTKEISHFDFWPGYAQSASPNDSALFISHSTSPETPADPPTADIFKNFATVTPIDDPPLPDFDKSWDIWNCQNFIGTGGQSPGDMQTNPMRDSDALPK